MIIQWLDGKKEFTDELIQNSFTDYVLESYVAQGPAYSISTYPHWIEDLDEDNKDNAGVIRETLIKHWNAFLEIDLVDLREHIPMMKLDYHGRKNITIDGKMFESEKLTVEDENGKSVKFKELEPEQREKIVEDFTSQKKKELDEKVASADIKEYQKDEWEVDVDAGRIKFWWLEAFDQNMNMGDFLSRTKVEKWVGFDWDNQETVDKLISDSQKISAYFKNETRIPIEYFPTQKLIVNEVKDAGRLVGAEAAQKALTEARRDLKEEMEAAKKYVAGEGDWTTEDEERNKKNIEAAKKIVESKKEKLAEAKKKKKTSVNYEMEFTYTITGGEKGYEEFFKEIGADEFGNMSIKQTEAQLPTQTYNNWGLANGEGPVPFDGKDIVMFQNKNLAKNWLKREIIPAIHEGLKLDKYALKPHNISTITVNGEVILRPTGVAGPEKVTINLKVTTIVRGKIKIEETKPFPTKPPTRDEAGIAPKGNFRITTQFKTYTYNPLRREFSNHVAARLRRLGEKIGGA
jgi:hypothetical protein